LHRPFLTSVVLAALVCAGPLRSLDAREPAVAGNDDIEEVVVTAQRIEGSGSKRRTAASREELDRSDQTSMEGFFDDIDGLSTLGGDNQGNGISINGLSPDLSNVTLDGQSFGQGRGSGGFGAGDLPPDMIRRVDVYKSPAASQEEGGAAGSVNLQLRNPVEIAGPSNSLKGRLGYIPDKNNFNPSASYFMGRQSASRKFGYMLNLSLAEQTREYASQDIPKWILDDLDGTAVYYPGQVRNNDVKDRQGSAFAGLTLGFRPSPSLDISGKLFLSRKQRDIETHGLQHRFEKQRNITVLATDGRIASQLESSDPGRRNLRVVGGSREDETDSLVLGIDLVWRKDGWRVDSAIGYSTDENQNDPPSRSATFEANSAFAYSAKPDGSLLMSYADGFPPTQDFSISRINLSDRNTEDSDGFAGIDAVRNLGDGFMRRIRFGGKTRQTQRERRSATGRVELEEGLTLDDFFTGKYRQTPWDLDKWPGSDAALVDDAVHAYQADWKENLLNQYDMKRQTNAAYLQADFRYSLTEDRFLVGNVGARLVDTDTRINGFQENAGIAVPVSLKTHYRDVLPSISMRMRVAERAALSLAAARVMTHPSFNDLAPGIRFNYADKTARSGNPYLEPFRANQYLAELSWAPERGRRLIANLTYRDVESFFALGQESIEIDDDSYLVTRPVNGDDGYILSAGIRMDQNLRRLHKRMQDMTLTFAFTYNNSSTDMKDPFTGQKLPMPNTAEQVVKADLAYSREIFTGKLSYQWRGESLRASASQSGLSVWNQPAGSLNLNLAWQLSGLLQFNLDGRNLLSEEQVQTTDDSGQLWRITERDRSIAATLRARW
jgi:TonB-dependent receptor